MTAHDRTFQPAALYGSNLWAATRLGMSKDTFFGRKKELEAQGFPQIDPLTRMYHKASVDAWIENRATVRERAEEKNLQSAPNYDSL